MLRTMSRSGEGVWRNPATSSTRVRMESLLSFGDCFTGRQNVYVHVPLRLFGQTKVLLEKWLTNAGHAMVEDKSSCTVQICIHSCDPIPSVPLIIVSTEQPLGWFFHEQFAKNKRLYDTADWIWCMDNVDYNYLQTWFGVPAEKMRILPVMFGSFYVPALPAAVPSVRDVDVLQFGTMNERRSMIMNELASRKPGCTLVYSQTLWDEELRQMLYRTKVVVVPHYYAEPVSFGLHRLAYLLNFPHLITVVEDAPSSEHVRQLVQWFERFSVVPYDKLTDTVVAALDGKLERLDTSVTEAKIQRFSSNLSNWKGDGSWLHCCGAGL